MNNKTFLIEIGTEEMPPKLIREIAKKFHKNIELELKKNLIEFYKINLFDSPRRIAIQIKKLNTLPIIKTNKYRGPSIKNSFNKNGSLTISALKWLKKINIDIKKTTRLITSKGEWLFYENHVKNIDVKNILPEIIISSIKAIPVYKPMKWNQDNIKFFRPIRNITMLLNDKIIISNIFEINSNRYLYGNISTLPLKIKINHAKEYEGLLYKKGKVIVNFETRKKKNIL